MKSVLLACLILLLNSAFAITESLRLLSHLPPPPIGVLRSSAVFQSYFVQKLDHFNEDIEDTWSQKYNTIFYNESSPNVVFLILEGQGPASTSWLSYGTYAANAKKYRALMFQLEHRFYGDSQPFSELTTENLRYLSSRQALADAANFIIAMNEEYQLPSDVKWIVFGSAYSASLAAWMRLKYPDLVQGAVAASAPLHAEVDFKAYYQVVIDDLAGNSEECVANFKAGMQQVDDLITNPNEDESLTTIFNLCDPIEQLDEDDLSIQNFYVSLTTPIGTVVQYNGHVKYTIDGLCTKLANKTRGKEIYRLADVIKNMYGLCLDYNYMYNVYFLMDTTINQYERQWMYQTCTEFGWFQTTNREDKVLGNGASVDLFTNMCRDVFGPEFNETFINNQVDQTNEYYGGINIDVSNVVHVHGSLDPWHAAGLLESTNTDSPVIYIKGILEFAKNGAVKIHQLIRDLVNRVYCAVRIADCSFAQIVFDASHCAIMYEWSEGEVPELTAARNEVDRLLGVWLGVNSLNDNLFNVSVDSN